VIKDGNLTDVENARKLLKNVPDEMFDTWLRPIVERSGFPFSNVADDIQGTKWVGYLGYESLSIFSGYSWRKSTGLPVDKIPFKESSLWIIDGLITYNLTGKWTLGGRPIPDCKERFGFHVGWVQRTGRLIAPIVIRFTVDGFLVLDGSHRLAALFSLNRDDILIDAWMAESNPPVGF